MAGGEIAKLWASIGADLSGLETGLASARTKLQGASQSMGRAGRNLSLAVTAPVVAAGAGALKMASDFDQSMRNVNSVLLMNEEQFQAMKEDVIDFSLTTRASATEVADSLLRVASMGFRGEEALELMQYSARSAGAAFTSAEDMANLLGGAINSYGMEVDDASGLTDLFIYAMQQGAGSVTDLSNVLPRVFPTAAAAGMKIEELAGAMAFLGKRGLKAEEASIAMNQALIQIIKPTDELTDLMQKYGWESASAALQGEGFAGVMKLVEGSTGGSADEIAKLFPNIRSMRAVMQIATGSSEEFADSVRSFGDASKGAMEKARIEQYKSLESNLKRLKNVFGVLAVTVGNQLIPPLVELITRIIGPLREFVLGLSPDTIQLAMSIAGVAAAVGPLLLIGSKLLALLAMFANPVGLAIAAITALGAILATQITGWKDAFAKLKEGDLLGALGELKAPPGLQRFIDGVIRGFEDVAAFWDENGDQIKQVAMETFEGIVETGERLANQVLPFLAEQFEKIGAWFKENGPLIAETISILGPRFVAFAEHVANFWGVVQPILAGLINFILGGLTLAMQVFTGDWEAAWETVKALLAGVWESIKLTFLGFADFVAGWFDTSWAEIMAIWTNNWELIKIIASTVLAKVKSFISTKFDEIKTKIVETWQTIKDKVTGKLTEIKDLVKDKVQQIKDDIAAFRDKFINAGKNLMEGLKAGIISKVQAVRDAIIEAVHRAIEAAKKKLGISSDSKVFMEIGRFTMGGWATGIEQGAADLRQAMRRAATGVVIGARPVTGHGGAVAASGFAGAGGGSVVIHELHIHANTDDPKALAQQVMKEIAREASLRNALPIVSSE